MVAVMVALLNMVVEVVLLNMVVEVVLPRMVGLVVAVEVVMAPLVFYCSVGFELAVVLEKVAWE